MFEGVLYPLHFEVGKFFASQNFYCSVCISPDAAARGYAFEFSVKNHLKTDHGYEEPLTLGRDYLNGRMLGERLDLFRAENDLASLRSHLHFISLRGVDDFILECEA